MDLGGYSATGPRDVNEDNHYERLFSGSGVFLNEVDSFIMVSDGMGGYQGGDIASGLAVSSADHYLANLLKIANGNTIEFDPELALTEIARNAHEAIASETQARGNVSMGATFVGAFLCPSHAWIGHVGDSRAYLIRRGRVIQLTEDHSRVGRMLSRGVITEEEAQNHPERHKIERALGFENSEVEMTEVDLQPGDALMLCSDGAYTVLDSQTLGSLYARGGTANEIARRMVEAALDADTDDNTTISIAVRDDGASVDKAPRHRASQQPTVRKVPAHGAGDWSGKTEMRERASDSHVSDEQRRIETQRLKPVSRQVPAKRQESTLTRAPSRRESRRGSGSSDRRRSVVALIIPLVVFVVFTLGAVWLFVSARNGVSRESAVANVPGQNAVPEESGSGVGSDGSASQDYGSASDGETSYKAYIVTEDATLRFVDENGIAQRFTADVAGFDASPYVMMNATVTASTSEGNFGRNGLYRSLDSRYVRDLEGDCRLYDQGVTEFTSGLARITEREGYADLIKALCEQKGNSKGITIEKLLLRAQDLELTESGE